MKKSELSLTIPMTSKLHQAFFFSRFTQRYLSLTNFNKALVDLYLDIPYVEVRFIHENIIVSTQSFILADPMRICMQRSVERLFFVVPADYMLN